MLSNKCTLKPSNIHDTGFIDLKLQTIFSYYLIYTPLYVLFCGIHSLYAFSIVNKLLIYRIYIESYFKQTFFNVCFIFVPFNIFTDCN